MAKINECDYQRIIDLYVKEKKSTVEISKMFDVCSGTIIKVLEKNEVSRRKKSRKGVISKEDLFKEYWNNEKSCSIIAKEYNTSSGTILRLMKDYFIETRDKSSASKLTIKTYGNPSFEKGNIPWNKGIPMSEEQKKKLRIAKKGKFKGMTYEERMGEEKAKEYKEKLSLAMKRRKEKYGYMMSPEARKKVGKKNSGTMESRLGKVKADKIKKRMSEGMKGSKNPRYGIKLSKEFIEKRTRTVLERGSLRGENNPRWLGGKSFEPYDKTFNDYFKRGIRKRDNQLCMV